MPTGQNINMRVDTDLLDSIDHNAKQSGLNRTQYILSWLPDTYQPTPGKAETAETQQAENSR